MNFIGPAALGLLGAMAFCVSVYVILGILLRGAQRDEEQTRIAAKRVLEIDHE